MKSEDDKKIIEQQKRLADTLVKSGVATRAVLDENAMKVCIDWSPDGLRFRESVLRAYDLIAKRQSDNPLMELSRLVAFFIEVR